MLRHLSEKTLKIVCYARLGSNNVRAMLCLKTDLFVYTFFPFYLASTYSNCVSYTFIELIRIAQRYEPASCKWRDAQRAIRIEISTHETEHYIELKYTS